MVSAYGIDEPADDTDEVLAKVARELVAVFRQTGGTLLLDNVTTPEQVEWLVREWPADGPRLVVVGETAIGDVVEEDSTGRGRAARAGAPARDLERGPEHAGPGAAAARLPAVAAPERSPTTTSTSCCVPASAGRAR